MANRCVPNPAALIRATLLAIAAAGALSASPITLPTGLNPGDQYRLVFVTAGARDAQSADIGTYNTFVTDQANQSPALAALNTTWFAIASAGDVSAFTNIGGNFTIPIYNLNGELVASNSADLWDGELEQSINYDQLGIVRSTLVWTGSSLTGATWTPLGDIDANVGGSDLTTFMAWIIYTNSPIENSLPLYGISGTLTVPTDPVPEPGTMGLLVLGLVGLYWRQAGRNRLWKQ